MALVVCFGFFNEEYLIALVDFIAPCGGHQRTKEMDSAESLSSILWTLTPHPGESLRRDIIAAAGLCQFRIPVSGAGRLSPLRREDWVLCVRAWTVRVSVDFAGLMSFVFHWWWDRLFIPAVTWRFAIVFCWDYR